MLRVLLAAGTVVNGADIEALKTPVLVKYEVVSNIETVEISTRVVADVCVATEVV